jgi:hypothetical protein
MVVAAVVAPGMSGLTTDRGGVQRTGVVGLPRRLHPLHNGAVAGDVQLRGDAVLGMRISLEVVLEDRGRGRPRGQAAGLVDDQGVNVGGQCVAVAVVRPAEPGRWPPRDFRAHPVMSPRSGPAPSAAGRARARRRRSGRCARPARRQPAWPAPGRRRRVRACPSTQFRGPAGGRQANRRPALLAAAGGEHQARRCEPARPGHLVPGKDRHFRHPF